jgi:capsule polysaccharide export protein KpsE/RkpR
MAHNNPAIHAEAVDDGVSLLDLVLPLLENWKLWLFGSLAASLIALGVTYLLPPIYTARTSFMPPQQQQSGMAATLASLGGLAALTGIPGSVRNPADQYVALMQSANAQERLIDRFKLLDVYGEAMRREARRKLEQNSRFVIGTKDGLVAVEVDDIDPSRAAALANAYVEELRRMTSELAVTEAQQRRAFFEKELRGARDHLAKAQQQLQASGFDVGALRAEPRAAAEDYARLKAQVASAEVRVQVLRGSLAEAAPELRQNLDQLMALRSQLARREQAAEGRTGADYVANYREFKYREAVFEMFARQYELARVDESREGALLQVIDAATAPEYKSRPKRALIAATTLLCALLVLGIFIVARQFWREGKADPRRMAQHERLRAALGRGTP